MKSKKFLDKYWKIIIVVASLFFAILIVLFIPKTYQITCIDGEKHIFENKTLALEKYNECAKKKQNYINFNDIDLNNGIK